MNDRPQLYGDGSISLVWAGDLRRFRLASFGRLKELQELCNAGPMEILRALEEGRWRVEYYREVLRLGLLGAGHRDMDVVRLITRYVDEAPPLENVLPAQYVLAAGLTWPKEAVEELGKEPAGKTATEGAEAANLSSPKSTASGPRSTSPPGKSMNSRRGSSPRASKDGTASTGVRSSRKPPQQRPSTV